MELLSFSQIVAALIIVWIGSTIQAVIGMGLNLLAISLLFMLYAVFVPGLFLVASFLLTILAFYRMPAIIDYGELKISVTGLFVGTVLAGVF